MDCPFDLFAWLTKVYFYLPYLKTETKVFRVKLFNYVFISARFIFLQNLKKTSRSNLCPFLSVLKYCGIKNSKIFHVINEASIAQWQSTGLVNQGSWVQTSLDATYTFWFFHPFFQTFRANSSFWGNLGKMRPFPLESHCPKVTFKLGLIDVLPCALFVFFHSKMVIFKD